MDSKIKSDKKVLNSLVVFVVLGRLPGGLSISKVLPIIHSKKVKKVYIFSDKEHIQHEKAETILVPKFFNESNLFKKIIRFIYEPLQLIYYSLKIKPDIINGVFTIPKGYNSYFASKISRANNIISILGNTNEIAAWIKYTNIVKRIHLWFYRKTNVVTTKGNKISNYLFDHGIPEKKIFIFNGAIDTERFVDKNLQRGFDIIFVGKFSELKGPDRVLKVISKLKNDFPDIRGVFLGSGDLYPEIEELIKKLGLSDNVSLEGYKNNTQEYYKQSKILMMPSRSEGLSTAMLEAMACGCVPIVSDVGSMSDAAIHDFNSRLIDRYDNIDMFYEQAKLLLNDETKRIQHASNAIEYSNNNYSVSAQVEVFDSILKYLYN